MASEQTKQAMMRAKKLIQAKEYGQARKILEQVNHPTATKWLAQLDDIELGDPFEQPVNPPKQRTKQTKKRGQWRIWLFVAIGILVVIIGAFILLAMSATQTMDAYFRFYGYCNETTSASIDECNVWEEEIMDNPENEAIVFECSRENEFSAIYDYEFYDCLEARGIIPFE